MNSHKHAELMAAYAADAQTTDKPWELWEINTTPYLNWKTLTFHPIWAEHTEYRRKPKTNAQVACELLGKAYDALEAHSAEIVEPNVDHIQRLVWDAKKLLEV